MDSNEDREYLAHHGVLGMKWGVRRYQPYGGGTYEPEHRGRFVPTGNARKDKRALKQHIKNTRNAYKYKYFRASGKESRNVPEPGEPGAPQYGELGDNVRKVRQKYETAYLKDKRIQDLNRTYWKSADMMSRTDDYAEKKRLNKQGYDASKQLDVLDKELRKSFSEEYRNAAAKDLGFADVEEGKRILDKYNLMGYAVNNMYFLDPDMVKRKRFK